MNIDLWMAALILASVYILLSLAFSITTSTTDAPNFSIGPLMTIGAYQSFILANIMNLPVYLSLPLALIIGFLFNSGIYYLVIKPLTDKNRSKELIVLATLALSIALTGLVQISAYWLRDFFKIYTFVFLLKKYDFKIGSAPGIFFVSGLIVFLVYLIWRHIYLETRLGISYRAILENPCLAQVQGVNIKRTWLWMWGLSGSLAFLGGAICPLWYSVTAGAQIITPVIAASLLGGLKNPWGSFIGGLFVGVSEIMLITFAVEKLGNWVGEYRPLIPIFILVLVLCFKPEGLLGSKNQHNKL